MWNTNGLKPLYISFNQTNACFVDNYGSKYLTITHVDESKHLIITHVDKSKRKIKKCLNT